MTPFLLLKENRCIFPSVWLFLDSEEREKAERDDAGLKVIDFRVDQESNPCVSGQRVNGGLQ